MSHTVSGVAAILSPQMIIASRPNPTSTQKPTRAFQAVESDRVDSVSQQLLQQAVAAESAADNVTSSAINSAHVGGDPRNPGDRPSAGTDDSLSGLRTSLQNSGSTTDGSAEQSSLPWHPSLKGLDGLGNTATTTSGPGSVINVVI